MELQTFTHDTAAQQHARTWAEGMYGPDDADLFVAWLLAQDDTTQDHIMACGYRRIMADFETTYPLCDDCGRRSACECSGAATAKDVDVLIAQGFDRSALVGRGDGVRVKCSGCEATFINGVACHEHGCPNQTYECKDCNATVARKGAYCEDCQ